MNNSLDFLQESILIEDLAKLELGLNKSAGLFESLDFNGVGSAIKSFVQNILKSGDEVPGGYFTSILSLMAPAVLMRVHPLLGVIYLIADQFGFNLSDIIIKIASHFKDKIEKGEPISPEEITSIGKGITGLDASASISDVFEYIKKEAITLKLKKIAYSRSDYPSIPFLFPSDNSSLLQKIVGNLMNSPRGASKVKWFLGGIAIWIVKTLFAGAGLLALAGGVSSLLGHKRPEEHISHPENKSEIKYDQDIKPIPQHSEINQEEQKQTNILPSQPKSIWVVPLVGDKSIEDTLTIWTLDLYPYLKQYDDIKNRILNSTEFKKIVQFLKSDPLKIGKSTLVMPSQFTSRKQVVDAFIDDVKRNLQ